MCVNVCKKHKSNMIFFSSHLSQSEDNLHGEIIVSGRHDSHYLGTSQKSVYKTHRCHFVFSYLECVRVLLGSKHLFFPRRPDRLWKADTRALSCDFQSIKVDLCPERLAH